MSVYAKDVTRSGYFTGCANEGYLQLVLSFSNSVSLKKYDQAMLILRHERRFPPAPAPLVQKVSQRVLVFPRVTRKLDYDGLVFFHADGKMKIC